MKRTKLAVAVLALCVATGAAHAQGINTPGGAWQTGWTPGTKVDEFWNNLSDDGASCNVGFFALGTFSAGCKAQNPGPLGPGLGWADASYLSVDPPSGTMPPSFFFSAGTYKVTYFGNVAGADPMRMFGYRAVGTDPVTWFTAGTSTIFTADDDFEFVLQAWSPTGAANFTSFSDPRMFAVFADQADGSMARNFLVGAEDNNCEEIGVGCARISDRDYNDALALIQVVPEPSTYMLMGAGLLGLYGVARRRRAA